MSSKIEEIMNWLEILVKEAIATYNHLDLFKWFDETVNNNNKLTAMDATFLNWMKHSFTVDLVISLARLCDSTGGTKSLIKFLENLKKNYDLLTRERHKNLYRNSDSPNDIADITFNNLAGNDKNAYDVEKIESDIQILTSSEIFRKILNFRHDFIAHIIEKKREPIPTYSELYEAYNILESIIQKYYLLLTAIQYPTLTPAKQGNWKAPFTIAWLEKSEKL